MQTDLAEGLDTGGMSLATARQRLADEHKARHADPETRCEACAQGPGESYTVSAPRAASPEFRRWLAAAKRAAGNLRCGVYVPSIAQLRAARWAAEGKDAQGRPMVAPVAPAPTKRTRKAARPVAPADAYAEASAAIERATAALPPETRALLVCDADPADVVLIEDAPTCAPSADELAAGIARAVALYRAAVLA